MYILFDCWYLNLLNGIIICLEEEKKKDILCEIYTTAFPMDVLLAIAFSFSILQQNLPQSLSNDYLQMFVR